MLSISDGVSLTLPKAAPTQRLFADSHRFQPERFLDTQPDGAAWLPWGGGRKRCLGWRSVIVTPHRGCRVILRERHQPARIGYTKVVARK